MLFYVSELMWLFKCFPLTEAMCDSANTFPVYKPDALVQFFRTEVLIGQEAKHFAKSDITPTPKVNKMF